MVKEKEQTIPIDEIYQEFIKGYSPRKIGKKYSINYFKVLEIIIYMRKQINGNNS